MAGSPAAQKRTIQSRTKVKTGCATCRIRKIKCDESKPFCKKCVDTGRTCDGYESPFRSVAVTGQAISSPRSTLAHRIFSSRDIDLLNRYFSIKTMFDVKLACGDEARQVLQASLTDLPIQHAVSSLKVLREDLETSGGVPASVAQPTASHDYGVRKYCKALRGLASALSSPGSDGLRSALLCCQVFISIEQVRGNYAAMGQHIIQGLGIMRESRARPSLVAASELVPARREQLPLLDVFVIKLFAAPCKYVDLPVSTAAQQQPAESHGGGLRPIVPDRRKELTKIAQSTLEFLDRVSRVGSAGDALELLTEKASLLDSLGSWLARLELDNAESGVLTELLSVLFTRLLHQILRIVLLGALDFSPEGSAQLRMENGRLEGIAREVGKRVKDYFRTLGETGSGQAGECRTSNCI